MELDAVPHFLFCRKLLLGLSLSDWWNLPASSRWRWSMTSVHSDLATEASFTESVRSSENRVSQPDGSMVTLATGLCSMMKEPIWLVKVWGGHIRVWQRLCWNKEPIRPSDSTWWTCCAIGTKVRKPPYYKTISSVHICLFLSNWLMRFLLFPFTFASKVTILDEKCTQLSQRCLEQRRGQPVSLETHLWMWWRPGCR